MSIRDPKRVSDGFWALTGGVDSGSNPSIINDDQVAFAVNVTFRGGFANNRPGFDQLELRFGSQDDLDNFQDFNVQGAAYYDPMNADPEIIASIGGRIFRIRPTKTTGVNVDDITISGDANPANRKHAWMVQAEEYFVIQDGQSVALIYDGATLRRSNLYAPHYEVPVGMMMEYGLGRLAVVRPGGRDYVVGDLVNGGTEVIQFTENEVIATGGPITVPIQGKITALKIIAVLDNSTGQGDLVVHTSNGAVSARIGENRSTWKNIQFQRTAIVKNGALSQFSTVLVNGDMFFRSKDGIRSLAMSRRDFNTTWQTTPVSREMERVLQYDDRGLLDFSYAVLFDNRLLFTINPAPIKDGVYHRGLVALDFDLVSSMQRKLPPAYDGLWTGLKPTALVAGDFPSGERCFVFHRTDAGENEIWEVTRNALFDGVDDRISSFIETRSCMFNSPRELKKLETAEIGVDNVVGQVDFSIQYRPDQYPCWQDWHSWSECANYRDCTTNELDCMSANTTAFRPQYHPRMTLPQPPDACETGDNKPMRLFYESQAKISWTGRARIKALLLHAYDQQMQPARCEPSGTCNTVACCDANPFAYEVDGEPATVEE